MSGPVTIPLARWACAARPPDLAIRGARGELEACVQSALSASAAARAAFAVALAQASQPEATVIGHPERMSATWAAFANGGAGLNSVVAAALAVGEPRGATMGSVLSATAVGLRAGAAVESALATSAARRRWAPGAIASLLGSAVAAGLVLELDAQRLAAAIGLAATQAAGITRSVQQPGGRMLLCARSAFDGTEAALLTQAGFTAPPNGIEGRRGLAALTAPGADLGSLIEPDFEPVTASQGPAEADELDGLAVGEALAVVVRRAAHTVLR